MRSKIIVYFLVFVVSSIHADPAGGEIAGHYFLLPGSDLRSTAYLPLPGFLRLEDPTNSLVCRYVTKEDYALLLQTSQLPPKLDSFSGFQGISLRGPDGFPAGTTVYPGLCTSPDNPRPYPILFGVPPHTTQEMPPPPFNIEDILSAAVR